jgi:hypothetical protein
MPRFYSVEHTPKLQRGRARLSIQPFAEACFNLAAWLGGHRRPPGAMELNENGARRRRFQFIPEVRA